MCEVYEESGQLCVLRESVWGGQWYCEGMCSV